VTFGTKRALGHAHGTSVAVVRQLVVAALARCVAESSNLVLVTITPVSSFARRFARRT
jgi:hypothetical protein